MPYDDWRAKYDAALKALGICECGHPASEHWHSGPLTAPTVFDCDHCRKCPKFKPVEVRTT
jgi:hypothetical protein